MGHSKVIHSLSPSQIQDIHSLSLMFTHQHHANRARLQVHPFRCNFGFGRLAQRHSQHKGGIEPATFQGCVDSILVFFPFRDKVTYDEFKHSHPGVRWASGGLYSPRG